MIQRRNSFHSIRKVAEITLPIVLKIDLKRVLPISVLPQRIWHPQAWF